MKRRVFRSIFLVAVTVTILCFALMVAVLYQYFSDIQKDQLSVQAALVARGVDNEGIDYFEGLDAGDYRITWISGDGTVLYDTVTDAESMENHTDREEFKEALETGTGESERYSETISEKTFYSACLLSDGSVIRTAVTQRTVFALALGMLPYLILLLLLSVILSVILARRLSGKIVEPLNNIDFKAPLENNVYEELTPMLTQMEHQRRQIKEQLDELQRKRDEFSAITGNMNEGLIVINNGGTILSINNAAMRLFGANESCIGKDILTVCRLPVMQELLGRVEGGNHGEAVVELNGGEYQIDVSPVVSAGSVTGSAILTFDVTEKVQAERNRREFTANVSHELKTPLQSIMGSAELMENGLVRQEDMPRFIGHIRTETERLVSLIEDIIRLSQLDEGGEMPEEDIDLLELAKDVRDALTGKAAEENVAVSVDGENIIIHSVRRLVWEIVNNLCDNAIKYNVDGGSVTVSVRRVGSKAVLVVADTGIGIPPEHQGRVFERFYRVDKSHSKETGGTGLGLSIVKHAVQYVGATIKLTSTPGRGTVISVRFPIN